MRRWVTIAGARIRHNRRLSAGASRSGLTGLAAWIVMLCSWLPLTGCVAGSAVSTEVPVWELAQAEPVLPHTLGRARVGFDRPLPEHLIQSLCDEFSLVLITDALDWKEIRRRFGFSPLPAGMALSDGMIVGIVAKVGECAHDAWPIHLEQVRVCDGAGWVEASFSAGLYHPIRTAGYLELAYVPNLRQVRMVCIGHRRFIIRSRSVSH